MHIIVRVAWLTRDRPHAERQCVAWVGDLPQLGFAMAVIFRMHPRGSRCAQTGRPIRLDSPSLRQYSVDNAGTPIIAEKVVGPNDYKQSGRIQNE
jgi:hypothetical protein